MAASLTLLLNTSTSLMRIKEEDISRVWPYHFRWSPTATVDALVFATCSMNFTLKGLALSPMQKSSRPCTEFPTPSNAAWWCWQACGMGQLLVFWKLSWTFFGGLQHWIGMLVTNSLWSVRTICLEIPNINRVTKCPSPSFDKDSQWNRKLVLKKFFAIL